MKKLTIYIAASWKHQHAVEMLTALLRERGHEVKSFVENNHGEGPDKRLSFDEWVNSDAAKQSFDYDTSSARSCDVTIYIGPSGKDAAAEVGIAWGAEKMVLGLYGKGEDFGLMRKMILWHDNYLDLLKSVDVYADSKSKVVVGLVGWGRYYS